MFKLSVELLPIGGICVINVNLNVTEYFEELGGLCQKCEKKKWKRSIRYKFDVIEYDGGNFWMKQNIRI